MSFKPSTVTSESGHWYDRSGIQVSTVLGSKGQQVKPDIRHARKFGFAPGVTTILKVAHKEQLVQYRERQVLLASLTLPQISGESQEDWIRRIMVDAKTHAVEAAERGSAIHATIEQELKAEHSTNPWVLAVREAIQPLGVLLPNWRSETPCVHNYGYGTKSDLNCDVSDVDNGIGDVVRKRFVLDIKTKEGDLSDVVLYAEHYQQLAATANALNMPDARCGIVFVSRTEPVAKLVMADKVEHGWTVFKASLHLWQVTNNYAPEWATRIYYA